MQPAKMIAVDWGTTNRRAYVLDRAGNVTARHRDGRGILSVPPGGFPAAVAELREALGNSPMLLAGMVGSNRGWIEAPYVPCPASLDDIIDGLARIPDEEAAVVPGVVQRGEHTDVMRGEEIQLLGAVAAGLASPDADICHPGTHAKWAKVRGGAIASFRTIMTGELFALLKKHSILSAQLKSVVAVNDAFRRGVMRSLAHAELVADLFSVRARGLLGELEADDAASYASGLLIGADVGVGLAFLGGSDAVVLIGEETLTTLYAAALEEAGRATTKIAGETAFLAGIKAVAEKMS